MTKDDNFKGRFGPSALITGASDGIGRAFAVALAERGFDLILVARRQDVLETLATDLSARFGVEVQVIASDLSDPAAVPALLVETDAASVGLVIAAAGFGSAGAFLDLDPATEANMVDLNCRSVVALCHGFGQRLAQQGRGGIVLFSSLVGFSGAPYSATYAATKGFVQSFAEGIAPELGARGVSVLSVAPGPVGTGFAARAGMQMGQAATPETIAGGALAALGKRGTVRPGFLAKLLGWSLAMLPRAGRVRVLGAIMKGMAGAPSSR
ncbi:SDR family NAD(P)-dependent oxidoreductase [Yoonia vestfoldensis]|uniref:SDR family NAD(P)-dependent oxidoreductase n=1 Tax=Yoonia vestfoldensis TaxID=245188 RepID=UPI0003998624|nr:SDR family NAD(P)-dependent oxidoreductase [Yoonia vestfoldensis]